MKILTALYRSPSYSPLQHRANDTAILDLTVGRMEALGWRVQKVGEAEVERGRVPPAQLYLNMCQGPLASEQLVPIEADGATVVNRASSVLSCHRHRLVRRLMGSVAFPLTLILNTGDLAALDDEVDETFDRQSHVWVKRGDVHAQRPEDVVRVPRTDAGKAAAAFALRGIPWVAVQEHVWGPVVKFYGLADGCYFRWYEAEAGPAGARPPVDEAALRQLALTAARYVGLDVFGGDAVVAHPALPVLIDLNDWPSFAPFRDEAALAISNYVNDKAEAG